MGCGCAGVERAALTIAAAGGGAKILGPQRNYAVECSGDAVLCDGAALTLQGLAVEGGGEDYEALSQISSSIFDGDGGGSAVSCTSKGRAELSGCTLTSPEGTGLEVRSGATATMDGGSISGCGRYGVFCEGSGSTATVRPPAAAPSAAPPVRCGRRARRRFSAPFCRFSSPFSPCFGPSEPP